MSTYRYPLVATLIALTLAACQSAATPTAAPAEPTPVPAITEADLGEQNMAVVRAVYDAIAAGDAQAMAALHSNPFILNYPGGVEEVDPNLMGQDLAALRNANPDLHAEVQDMYASGDLVVTQVTWRATHTGDFFGLAPTGNQVFHNGVVVRRLQDGKVVESWETFDDFEFLHNLGFVPSWDEIVAQSAEPAEPVALPTLAPNQVSVTTPEELAGIWEGGPGTPGDPPQTYWWFKPDGTYHVTFTLEQFAEGYAVEAGKFTFDGSTLTLEATRGGCAGDPTYAIGTFEARVTTIDGQPGRLKLIALSDECTPRKNGTRGVMPYVQAEP